MPNGNIPDDLPAPVDGFGPSVDGPSLHVYNSRGKAEKVAERIRGETRVRRRKVDGRQRHVVERKSNGGWADGVSLETWVEAPYDPDEVA